VAGDLDEVVNALLEPLLHAVPPPRGWRLASVDAEQGICLTLGRDDAYLLVELEARDEARPCYARTERFNVCARRTIGGEGRTLDAGERRVVDQIVALVRAREDRLPQFERPTASRRVAVREVEVERLLVAEGARQYYANPYVGCTIGCPFCYVAERADFSRALAGLPRVPWGRYVDVKINAARVLAIEVGRQAPGTVRLSPIVTDPYQPIERRYRITRSILEVLLPSGFAPVILTRAARVLDDLDLLKELPRVAVGFSIPTDDDRVRREFEPGADPIEDRLAAIEELHGAGLTTFAVIQPVLPMDPARLVEHLAPHVDAVRVDRMYEMRTAAALYAAAGREDAATDAFFSETARALRRGFADRGVLLDDLDDMARLIGTP